MSSSQDPFYIVKEEIQESIDKLQSSFHHWEGISSDVQEKAQLTRNLFALCRSIEWQVDLLDKAISVASTNPACYGIDEVELDQRRKWTNIARIEVRNVKKAAVSGDDAGGNDLTSINRMQKELMRLPNTHQVDRLNQYTTHNDDVIQSESDWQLLLIKQQDKELDELSASVTRIGDVGLTIHEELLAHGRIIDDLETEMDGTSARLNFIQKKVALIMKKASAKGQIMMILFLVILFITLFVLVFFK